MSNQPEPICPWNGLACPGVDNCAPAIMGASEVDGKMQLTCPIAHCTSALSWIANRLQVLAEGAKKEEPRGDIHDFVKIDQLEPGPHGQ